MSSMDDLAMEKIIKRDLNGLDEVYAAIDTYDMAIVVRAATNVLRKNNKLPIYSDFKKSSAASLAARKTGNEHYKAERHRQALYFYNKAIAFAPINSEETLLGFGNRSAVFLSIKYHSACFDDVNVCLTWMQGCPSALKEKLLIRRNQALIRFPEEQAIQLISNTEFVCTFMSFNCKKNANIPCVSNDVAFVNRDDTKLVTARNNIKPGTLVAMETAFSTCNIENKYLCCYFCNKIEPRLFACPNCCHALFCSNECLDICLKEYHSVECHILGFLGNSYEKPKIKLTTRTAIKLSLKLGWNAFIQASKDLGSSRMKKSSVKQIYNPEEPLSILSYDDKTEFMEGRMFNGGFDCAVILHLLGRVAGYFPTGTSECDAAWNAMAKVMLHLYVTFTNKIPIICSAYDFNKPCFRSDVQTNFGWFSMSSKLKHSCDPNLMVVGLNNSIALVTLRTITKGEELTISYIGHFYDSQIPSYINDKFKRQIYVFLKTYKTCECKACLNNWDSESVVEAEMTEKQEALFMKVKQQKSMDYKCFYSMCSALDIFSINSLQHKCAYEAVKGMLKPIQSKYFQNKTFWI